MRTRGRNKIELNAFLSRSSAIPYQASSQFSSCIGHSLSWSVAPDDIYAQALSVKLIFAAAYPTSATEPPQGLHQRNRQTSKSGKPMISAKSTPLLHLLPTLSLTNHLGQRIPVHRTHIRLPAELVPDGARGVEGHVYTRGVSAGGAVDWSSAPGVGFFRELLDVSDIPARDMGLGMSETAGK